jgi:putative lipoprotein (rSAM/lipoprotein system)
MNVIKKASDSFLFRILKLLSLCLSAILGLFCNSNVATPVYGVVAEYGMPWAKYTVSGTIRTSDTQTPINGIRVTLRDTAAGSQPFDTVYTDTAGKYSVEFSNTPWYNTWVLDAEDVDGSANGEYDAKDTIISIPDTALDSASGSWYRGHGKKNIDLDLNRH